MELPPLDAGQQGRLTVDLKAICDNWRVYGKICANSEVGAVVKADAYGLGIENVSQALEFAGCKTFFVASLFEAEQLRYYLPEATIYFLNGLCSGSIMRAKTTRLRPVLNSIDEIKMWAESGAGSAAIHVDTGMNRLGLSVQEFASFALPFEPALLMTHFASADLDSDFTPKQAIDFALCVQQHPSLQGKKVPVSLANSAGAFHGVQCQGDVVRPGIGLFGGLQMEQARGHFKHVVKLEAAVLQVRTVEAGQSVGYAQSWVAKRPSRIATVSCGYADGFSRMLSNDGARTPYMVYYDGRPYPVVGRVSMDLIAIDVTDAPQGAIEKGALLELLGENNTIIEMANASGTISYEVLTSFGFRFERLYLSPR